MRDGRILAALVLAGVLAYVLLTPAPIADLSDGGRPIPTDPTRAPGADFGPGSPVVHAVAPPLTVREARVAVEENRAIDRILGYTSYVSRGGDGVREVALTFDDGPSAYTQGLLGELRSLHVPATFFQIGYAIAEFPGYAAREVEFGMTIGDHRLTHPFLANMSLAAQAHEIVGDARRIHAYGAAYPRLMRPPYESFNHLTTDVTRAARMLMVLWSVDTADYTRPGVKRIVYAAVSGARPGAIILLHDGGGPRSQTVAAVPTIVRDLRRRHYRLVTVPRLLLDDPPPPPPRSPEPSAKSHAHAIATSKSPPGSRAEATSRARAKAEAEAKGKAKAKAKATSKAKAKVGPPASRA
ncbi:MAG TPA: polysaccharide deacetylase family protein [Solirubrobacteraceae bacterium]|jgi:peptidoglycan/xylan/chitin deacetylase (PgdA/CDA1 family)|nr:polysaccharide deacetylase family protein [Solirubrobacteraceae bacterium]